jgi:hypothetical protein
MIEIQLEKIEEILSRILSFHPLFFGFKLIKKNIEKKHFRDTLFINYNFEFISEIKKRNITIVIQDSRTSQTVWFWIKNLENENTTPLSISDFFIKCLKNNAIKQILIFKCKSELEFEENLSVIIDYIVNKSDDQLKKVIEGKVWIEIPFDWSDYK